VGTALAVLKFGYCMGAAPNERVLLQRNINEKKKNIINIYRKKKFKGGGEMPPARIVK